MIVRVAGVAFRDAYPDALLDLEEYMSEADESESKPRVKLERDPDNEYDPNAVKVLVPLLEEDAWVGYIPEEKSKQFAKRLDKGRKYHAFVSFVPVSFDGPNRPGLDIDVRWSK